MISMASSSLNDSALLTYQNENIDNSERIANIFNSYFSIISEKTQAEMKHPHKNYTDYLTNENSDSFFLSSTKKEEIYSLLSRYQQIYCIQVRF